ncbi:MAG: ABC transporter substrate-binding protein [Betaproteobacteria bacterium]
MKRRDLLATAAASLAWPTFAFAQGPRRYRIGFLGLGTPATGEPFFKVFFAHMQALGYSRAAYEFDTRFADGDTSKLRQFAEELAASKPDVLMGAFNPTVAALKTAAPAVPIVMLYGGAPVEAGLVESLARPGGNVTGLAYAGPETSGKAFEVMREAFPQVRRVLCLYESPFPAMALYVEASQRAAAALGLTLVLAPIQSAKDIDPALARVRSERVDGIFVGVTVLLYKEIAKIIEGAARERVPAVYTASEIVGLGGLMSYAAITDHWPRAAVYIDKILKGARPADLPIEKPVHYELAINLRTAKAIGVRIPASLVARADRVIE